MLIAMGISVAGTLNAARASEMQTIAIMPFEAYSPEDISHIKTGITRMLYSRLSWKEHVTVLDSAALFDDIDAVIRLPRSQAVRKVAEKSSARYVLSGSITHFAGAYSLDATVFDTTTGKSIPFFEQAKTVEEVIPKLNHIAARINKDIFDRTTVAYKKMEEEKNSNTQQLQRMNPEQMMPFINHKKEKEDFPFWKFWKYF